MRVYQTNEIKNIALFCPFRAYGANMRKFNN